MRATLTIWLSRITR